MSWAMANRVAHIAATKAHGRLNVAADAYPVNIDKAIDDAGLSLMRQPLPRLFGVYVESGGNAGILVNSTMSRATRRHTAAHELGHHEFGHQPDPGRKCTIELPENEPGAPRRRQGVQGDVEMAAEAFAAWFLMPRRAVLSALADMYLTTPATSDEVYQLSLRLGTTYRATTRHLVNLRIIRPADAQALTRLQPARLKRQLAAQAGLHLDSTSQVDVWDLRQTDGGRVEASIGDILVLPSDPDLAPLPGTVHAAEQGLLSALICTTTQPLTSAVAAPAPLDIVIHSRPAGLYLPYHDLSLGGQPLDDLETVS